MGMKEAASVALCALMLVEVRKRGLNEGDQQD
jgi:hypothetical protein